MRAEDLLAAVFPQAIACQENIVGDIAIPDHLLVRETMNDVLDEALDLEGLQRVLGDIAAGRIRCLAVDTAVPSVFSHEILNANPYAYLDDAPLEERRARAVEMRRVLPPDMASEIGRLDPSAIAEVRADAWPDVRDADELHDALLTLVAVPEPETAAEPAPPRQQARFGKPSRARFPNGAASSRNWPRSSAPRARCTAGAATGCAPKEPSSFGRFFPARSSPRPCRKWARPRLRATMRSSHCSAAGWPTRARRRRRS